VHSSPPAPVPSCRTCVASELPTSRAKEALTRPPRTPAMWLLLSITSTDAVDVIGYSMGCGTAARLLALHPPQVKSAILAGVGDYVLEDNVMEFPKNWPIPDSVPRPITRSVWAEEGARILEHGEIISEHLASASLIAARATEADPKVLAAVIRGAVMPTWPVEALRTIEVPVLILNGRADAANQKIDGLLGTIPTARVVSCEGDHLSTPTSRHSIKR
jgi:pimeloyl-ACP methyl ester carboxylesterase